MKQKLITKKPDFVTSISVDMEQIIRTVMNFNKITTGAIFNKNKIAFNVTGTISFDIEIPLNPEIKIKLNAV